LVLHREEFAWPRVSPRTPVRPYFKPRGAAPFHPSPAASDIPEGLPQARWLVCSLLHLSSHDPAQSLLSQPSAGRRPAVSGLAALRCSDFPLPTPRGARQRPPDLFSNPRADYSKSPL